MKQKFFSFTRFRWRKFFLSIKCPVIIMVIAIILYPAYFFLIQGNGISDLKSFIQPQSQSNRKFYYKIDHTKFTTEELDKNYHALWKYYKNSSPKLKKHEFITKSFERDLIIHDAFQKDFYSDPANLIIAKERIKDTLAQFYLEEIMKKKGIRSSVNPSSREISNFYDKNKSYYDQKNINKAQAFKAIEITLTNLKTQNLMQKVLKEKKIFINHISKEYKIERNTK